MSRNSVLEEFCVKRFAVIQDEIWSRALWRWCMLESKWVGRKHRKSWVSSAWRWWLREQEEMRVLRGVVYMTKSSGPRTEPWGTPQELCQEHRSVTHLTRKRRDDRYDLNQLRTEPWMPNQDDRRVITLTFRRCDGGQYHISNDFFAVFDPSPLTQSINCSF